MVLIEPRETSYFVLLQYWVRQRRFRWRLEFFSIAFLLCSQFLCVSYTNCVCKIKLLSLSHCVSMNLNRKHEIQNAPKAMSMINQKRKKNNEKFKVVIGWYTWNSDSARHAATLTHGFQHTHTHTLWCHVLIWLVCSTQFRYHFGCVKQKKKYTRVTCQSH